ncbi:ATP-grasp domain-containing protein [Methanococcus sp. CF]
MDLTGKKLLILGGTALSCEIIKQAKKQGVFTIVTDYLEDSPGKKIADKNFMVSTTDIDAVVKLIHEEQINGVLTGFIDSMLPYYQKICEKSNLPCYINEDQVEITTNKELFKKYCRNFEIPVVEEYNIEYPFKIQDIANIEYPVLVKPVDNSGARGIYICKDSEELIKNYEKALSFSKRKNVLIEKYVESKEATIFYLVQNGKIVLSSMGDRYVKHNGNNIIPLPVAYIFPSKNLANYQKNLNSKVVEMFKAMGIHNGMIFIQTFVDTENCIFYEMGYRLTGSLEYKIISSLNNVNPLEMMINYSLTGSMHEKDMVSLLYPNYRDYGFNMTFLSKPGIIGKINGISEVISLKGVLDVVSTYWEGDRVPESAVGTLQQVVLRVFGTAKNENELKDLMNQICSLVKIYSEDGENMLLEVFDINEL